ncbi:MAG: hypothetical protein H0T78_10740, partial [Longispora sp.]|nr:hypothetical protein [Longispora sp. (in: high G+C Gram-positive bacteria)]
MRLNSHTRALSLAAASLIFATPAAMTMSSPALASSTTVRGGSATGDTYTGNIQARLIGAAVVSSSAGEGTCNQSKMTGVIRGNGTGLTVSSASFT